ncbi:MAG: hypothetical protein OXH98_14550 [Caldilineaceae bacterium]|nr:hypothetical protein [Caldilineaceae bacterium]
MSNESRISIGFSDFASHEVSRGFSQNVLELIVESFERWREEGFTRNGDCERDFSVRLYDFMLDIQCERNIPISIHFEHYLLTNAMLAGHADSAHACKIDIAIFSWGAFPRHPHLSIECKRLGTEQLSRRYVLEGIVKYVDGRYGEKARYGVMVGYVMDGAPNEIVGKINAHVERRMDSRNCLTRSDPVRDLATAYISRHDREEPLLSIWLTHLLFCMQNIPQLTTSTRTQV